MRANNQISLYFVRKSKSMAKEQRETTLGVTVSETIELTHTADPPIHKDDKTAQKDLTESPSSFCAVLLCFRYFKMEFLIPGGTRGKTVMVAFTTDRREGYYALPIL